LLCDGFWEETMETPVILDDNYLWQYYNEFNPLYLNYICTLTGHYPISIGSGFKYCELGCGVGVTLNGLAELFPKGQFLGIDNNENYIVGASALAKGVGCSNLDFKCLNFNRLSTEKLPDFDFIILNDIYSWIDKDARQHVQDFIANHLKDDGILYLNYEAMPGSSVITPLRDIISFHTSGMASDNLIKAQSGLDYLDFMQSNKAGYFTENIAADQFFNDIRTKDINYVANRILSNSFQPYFFHQIVQEMGKIGLSFSGSAICHLNFIDLAVPLEFQAFLKGVATREQFETHGDLIRNQRFRKDIFIKSNKTMGEQEQIEILSKTIFGTTCLEEGFELMAVFGDVELSYNNDTFKHLISVLSDTPKSPVSLLANEQLKDFPLEVIIDAMKFLVAGGQILPFVRASEDKAELDLDSDRYSISTNSNIEILKNRLFKQDKITLLAPNAGIGLQVTMVDALFTLCTAEARRGEVLEWVMQRLIEANQELLTDGTTDTDIIAVDFKKFRKNCLPNLLRLGILEPVAN
jgi:SAM-dependent methyltransferase